MKKNAVERLAIKLVGLLTRIHDYCLLHEERGQPFGACIVNPKHSAIPPPSPEIQAELEKRATEYFDQKKVSGYYFRYWTPPILPIIDVGTARGFITSDDYQLTLEIPTFDHKWEQATMARSLLYCPADHEQFGWSDWFELQLEAVRLTPLLHQALEVVKIKHDFNFHLAQPGKPIFSSFVYDYGAGDTHFPAMSKTEKERWLAKDIDWKVRYKLAADAVKSATTLWDLYALAREKFSSTRNPMLKDLFKGFTEHIEEKLVLGTALSTEEKKVLLGQLRKTQKRESKGGYVAKKRPAYSISDIECGQVLYLLIREFLDAKEKSSAVAETFLFIWIAQHAAFSKLNFTVEEIFAIRVTDINYNDLTISSKGKEIDITEGLGEILKAWLGKIERKNKRRIFQRLTYDRMEDILKRVSSKFYGSEEKLLPKDFLEKVHVITGARIPLELRRQITQQEELVRQSPYRIDFRLIKKHIKEAISHKPIHVSS